MASDSDLDRLTDDQWVRLAPLMPGGCKGKRGPRTNNRLFMDAILWMARSGARWRDLPERFGDWKQVHTRLSRWAACGVWHELGEEVLDQVTCLEEVSVIVAANLPVCLRRDDRGLAGGGQWGEDTFISIEGLVGDDGIGLHGWQEVIGAEQIVRLTSGQVAAWLAENGLALHPDKMRIGDSREPGMGFDFLGYRFEAGQRLVRKKSLMALKDR